jgi:hypothetical protein
MASGDIINGLGDRNMRSALVIAEGMKTLLEQIEEAPPEVLEALLEHARAVQRSGGVPPAEGNNRLHRGSLGGRPGPGTPQLAGRMHRIYNRVAGDGPSLGDGGRSDAWVGFASAGLR